MSEEKGDSSSPSWLNKSFLETVLRSSEKEDGLTVTSCDVSRATAPGDNYGSDMFRVKVNFTARGQQGKKSFVVKAEPAKAELAKMLSEGSIFERESTALSVILPKMHSLLESAAPGKFKPFTAKNYYFSKCNPSAIFMEDLKEAGFRMATRTQGLDMNHSLLVIRRIAHYHASSAVLYESDPQLFEPFRDPVFNERFTDSIDSFFGKGMKSIVREVEGWPEGKERFAKKLDAIAENATKLLIGSVLRDDSDFNTFSHGDLWLNNLMFHYSDGSNQVEDVRFVDLQLCHYTSPAQDLVYFLHTSVSPDLQDNHQELLEEYLKTLRETFTLLGHPHLTPSKQQLEAQIHKKGTYAVIMSCVVLPIIYADTDTIPDFEKVLKNQDTVRFSPLFKQTLRKLIPHFQQMGWLKEYFTMPGESIVDENPQWLNTSFLEKTLRSSEDDEKICVTSYEVSRATAPGDNYVSDMFRVKVDFCKEGRQQTMSLVVKAELLKEEMTKVSRECKMFERESVLLSDIVPRIYKILQEALSVQLEPLAARCLYSHFDQRPAAIVLEDLKRVGFKMAERTSGLDMDHCLLVLRTLARYHAGSVILYRKHPEAFGLFKKSIYCEEIRDTLESFFGKGIKSLADEVSKWPEFEERYSIKLKAISEVATDYMINCQAYDDPDDFIVLTHADLWLNNMMFRYSDTTNKVQDVRFVDFQLGFVGNVALDLQYFLHTSPSIELLNKQHILVEEYHKTLGETFSALGHKELHPSLEQLNKQLHNKGMFAVIIACCLYALVLSDRSDVPDMEKVLKNEDTVHFTEQFRDALKILLPVFEKKGWLEVKNFISL